jgi:hypothetical protein
MVHMFLRKLQLSLSLLIKKRSLRKYGVEITSSYKKDRKKCDGYIDSVITLRDEVGATTVETLIELFR